MAAHAEKEIDAIMAENDSDFANSTETPTTDLFAAPDAFEYPPPSTTELEDKLAAEALAYRAPFPVDTDRGYNPESLALEPYERFPKYCAPHPLHKEDSYYPESLALEEYEGGPRRPGRPRVRPYASLPRRNERKGKLVPRAVKPVRSRKASILMVDDEVLEDTIVVDVGEAAEDFDQLRKALKRSKAKLAVAREKTALLKELKDAENKLALEEEKTTSFAVPKGSRKRKALAESEDAPAPRRRVARATRASVNYTE
jgi:hypothetical protein